MTANRINSITLADVFTRLKERVDEVSLLEILDISSEDIVDRFADRIEDRFDQLKEDLFEEYDDSDPEGIEDARDSE